MTRRPHRFSPSTWLVALGVVLLVAAHAAFVALAWSARWHLAIGASAAGLVVLTHALWKRHR